LARAPTRTDPSVRIRLGSTVVRARNIGAGDSPGAVEIAYFCGDEVCAVRVQSCVLACWNMMIPYLCPELPEQQKEALRSLIKTPLIYASVALRNWTAFKALGISRIHAPGSYFSTVSLNQVVDIGTYRSVRSPDEPVLIRMVRTPCQPGCRCAIRIAPGSSIFSTPRSRPSSAISAINSAEP
jgi:spermidine dehydrogenase